MVKTNYNTPVWVKRFGKYKKDPKRAYYGLRRWRGAYRAFRRRLQPFLKCKPVGLRERAFAARYARYFKEPRLAHSRMSSPVYRRFRRLFTRRLVVASYRIVKKEVGRTRAFARRDERAFIRVATTLASFEVWPAATRHKDQVQMTARALYMSVIRDTNQKTQTGGKAPSSTSYLQRVQKESPGLWRKLQAAVRENA